MAGSGGIATARKTGTGCTTILTSTILQNFWGRDYYRSSEDLYFRYPPEMRIPVYHKQWQNYYPTHRKDPAIKEHQFFPMFTGERHTGERYYQGHHFNADVF